MIPIIGERLSLVDQDGLSRSYASALAEQMVRDDLVDEALLAPDVSLIQLAESFVSRGGNIVDFYDELLRASETVSLPVAKPLAQLASITDFKLFVSLGSDALLQKAIEEARPSEVVQHRVFRPGEVQDIGPEWPPSRPTVYHLFGRISAMPDYVASHDDLLEFMHALQSGTNRPRELFTRLSSNSLLIIGSAFSDWLALFFMRMSSEQRLSDRKQQVILVDDGVERRDELNSFVSHFSKRTRLVAQSAERFVEELRARWSSQSGEEVSAEVDVFISYAREDLEQATQLRAGLLARFPRLGIWLDKEGGLGAGDDYARKIHQQIRQAKAFIPIMSRTTGDADASRFFRREWAWAEARAFELGDVPFILPVSIDGDPDYGRADVPDTFKRLHWAALGGGAVTPDFVEAVLRVIRTHKKQVVA
ncbi:toll/interleukin-1 receptor domain-containing protein [Paramagnetospirillum marisnigri]|nr:toll/interleukin-1 receptor domain-containing protein [Paramagnetospirillum marisnigri]